jgi:predicted nucleic acid-binding protein
VRKSVVLDSYILLVLLEQHRGWTDVVDLFLEALEADMRLLLSLTQADEMFTMPNRAYDDFDLATLSANATRRLPISLVDVTKELWAWANALSRRTGLTYAASHAAALAIVEGAELATGDQEFRRVEQEIPIRWVGVRQ